jgi:fructose-1-phosphate kinase PfkB-like protein
MLARRASVRVLLDCDGEPFRKAIRARPFLVKPNEHELGQFCRRPLRGENAACRAARELSELTQGWVLLSRGRDGAVLVHARERFLLKAHAPIGKALNTVGAGDAMLASVAREIESDANPGSWLAHGIAAGTALTLRPAGLMPGVAQVQRLLKKVRLQ